MTNRPEDQDSRAADSHDPRALRIRPEQMPRPTEPVLRKRPLTLDQAEAWARSKELQPPK